MTATTTAKPKTTRSSKTSKATPPKTRRPYVRKSPIAKPAIDVSSLPSEILTNALYPVAQEANTAEHSDTLPEAKVSTEPIVEASETVYSVDVEISQEVLQVIETSNMLPEVEKKIVYGGACAQCAAPVYLEGTKCICKRCGFRQYFAGGI